MEFYYGVFESYVKRMMNTEFNFTIYNDDGKEEVSYNMKNAKRGWNELGIYHFSPGNYKVELSDESEKRRMIIADAIKWTKR